MSISGRIKVLCVDDHPMVRDGIAFAIRQQNDMELIGEAADGSEAVEAFRKCLPDVTLMDLQMPQMNGIDAIAAIRAEFPDAKIVILSTYAGDVQASRALKVGAVGYILKGLLRSELVDTIRAVHSGQRRIIPQVSADIASRYAVDDLSLREIEVLQHVASGCSNKIVADKLDISEDTVKGHMKNVLAKLAARDRTHAVTIAIKRGYLEK